MRGWPIVWVHTSFVWLSHIWNLLKLSLQDYTVSECPPGSTCMGFTFILMCPWWYIKTSFRLQTMNKDPSFASDITLMNKNLVLKHRINGWPRVEGIIQFFSSYYQMYSVLVTFQMSAILYKVCIGDISIIWDILVMNKINSVVGFDSRIIYLW